MAAALAGDFSPGEIVVPGGPDRHPVPLQLRRRVPDQREVVHQVQRVVLIGVGAVGQGRVTTKESKADS